MAFTYYRSLTVDNTKVPSTQTNFPVLVLQTLPTAHVLNASGFDIRPYADSGLSSALTFELESYNSGTGVVIMWVKIPSLTSSTVFYLAYGDAALTTNGSSASTWDSNFQLVTHLASDATMGNDSTSPATNGTVAGNTVQAAVKIGNGASFDGTGDYIDFGDNVNLGTSNFTLSFWHQFTSGTLPCIIDKNYPGPGYSTMWIDVDVIRVIVSDGTILVNPAYTISSPNALHHYAFSINRATALGITFLIDGVTQGPVSGGSYDLTTVATITNSNFLGFGSRIPDNPGNYIAGTLDEVHISDTNRTENWLITEYNSQSTPGTFLALGTETAVGGGATILMGDQLN